ncbi:MAG: putative DNA polymerase delta catalytic subunit [Streblomastix strix]|uniref:DNA polymerase n=1 Tax=Streblomastix strix TaxID=222440 RepID=A0A5J4W7K0_9EUKA|nr:MAG: putative DNA polymerase delta catalytic subunit [Streblomastix strix]
MEILSNPKPDFSQHQRSKVGIVQDESQPLILNWIYTDYTIINKPFPVMSGQRVGKVPIIHLYGITDEDHTVLCNCHGFTPYLYIQCPSSINSDDKINAIKKELNNHSPLLSIFPTKKRSIYYYSNVDQVYLKINVQLPSDVPKIRSLLESGLQIQYPTGSFDISPMQTYESNIDFVLRHLFDVNGTGCSWAELSSGSYTLRTGERDRATSEEWPVTGTCHYEADISFKKVIFHDPQDPQWMRLPPYRIMSFDIECSAKNRAFPRAELNEVIQIAATISLYDATEPLYRVIFVLNTCLPILGATVYTFAREDEILIAFRDFIHSTDPDIIIGYNIMNFDIPYIHKRTQTLNCLEVHEIGRIKKKAMTVKMSTFHSNQQGHRETHDISIDGRVMIDMLTVMQNEHKLTSYSLNSVSQKFVGEQKEDVHYSIIATLFEIDAESRQRLAVYCLKDSLLPLKLMDKMKVIVNFAEMSRVTGVPMSYLTMRGQQVRVISQLQRKAMAKNMVVPSVKQVVTDDKYQGATVIDPIKGFYADPIVTLVFSSLYPSIMICHNLTPTGNYFIQREPDGSREGILPEILKGVLVARKRAKDELKLENDSFNLAVLNGRQLALKIVVNSIYGFTCAQVGKLPCLEISRSVTAIGREMIDRTKNYVEDRYTKVNGFDNDAIVVYGDTDSVMVKFGMIDLHKYNGERERSSCICESKVQRSCEV